MTRILQLETEITALRLAYLFASDPQIRQSLSAQIFDTEVELEEAKEEYLTGGKTN